MTHVVSDDAGEKLGGGKSTASDCGTTGHEVMAHVVSDDAVAAVVGVSNGLLSQPASCSLELPSCALSHKAEISIQLLALVAHAAVHVQYLPSALQQPDHSLLIAPVDDFADG
jgi:hypothetical protein